MRYLKAGYVLNEQDRECKYQDGYNYWWAYIVEIADRMGLTAEPLSFDDLPEKLNEFSVLFIGEQNCHEPISDQLEKWLTSGGTLIGCNTSGLDRLFGNEFAQSISQADDVYAISGELYLTRNSFTDDIHSPLYPDKPLLTASSLRLVKAVESETLGRVNSLAGITARKCGDGWAFYFGFDLAKTFWTIHQGRPVDKDYDGDGYLRTCDAIITGSYEPAIPYTDELVLLLQNMVAVQPYPMVYSLPPDGDTIPDVMLFYSGDDERSNDIQLPSAEFMHSRGLPYHINCMPVNGSFGVEKSDIGHLAELGTDTSLHYDFITGFDHPCGFDKSDIELQTRMYLDHFGKLPVCANMHCLRWTGWTEPAVWMMEEGIKSSNAHVHVLSKKLNPINEVGFAFGTSFPHFCYSEHKTGNRKLDFAQLPITAYEVGYEGDKIDRPTIEKALLLARHYSLIMNFFYHPVYIAQYPACRQAIDILLSLIKEQDIKALHSKPNEVTQWWMDRSSINISNISIKDEKISFSASSPQGRAFIVEIPLGTLNVCDPVYPCKITEKFGQRWLMLVLPGGDSDVLINTIS